MAIRDVVTMGYGNGTFSPGVNKIPTMGYSSGEAIAVPDSIFATNVALSLPTANNVSISVPTANDVTITESP